MLSKKWEENIQNAVRFYEMAHKRDGAIEKTMQAYLRDVQYDLNGLPILNLSALNEDKKRSRSEMRTEKNEVVAVERSGEVAEKINGDAGAWTKESTQPKRHTEARSAESPEDNPFLQPSLSNFGSSAKATITTLEYKVPPAIANSNLNLKPDAPTSGPIISPAKATVPALIKKDFKVDRRSFVNSNMGSNISEGSLGVKKNNHKINDLKLNFMKHQSKGTALMKAEELAALSHEEAEELFEMASVNRSEVRFVLLRKQARANRGRGPFSQEPGCFAGRE